mmetsp:Transcript_71450/g.220905  ORF Transcript_71450/g.220905 Transcript_71450/m.220905 type:complete len:203 (+) Transcript_71450:1471-2079(+)
MVQIEPVAAGGVVHVELEQRGHLLVGPEVVGQLRGLHQAEVAARLGSWDAWAQPADGLVAEAGVGGAQLLQVVQVQVEVLGQRVDVDVLLQDAAFQLLPPRKEWNHLLPAGLEAHQLEVAVQEAGEVGVGDALDGSFHRLLHVEGQREDAVCRNLPLARGILGRVGIAHLRRRLRRRRHARDVDKGLFGWKFEALAGLVKHP